VLDFEAHRRFGSFVLVSRASEPLQTSIEPLHITTFKPSQISTQRRHNGWVSDQLDLRYPPPGIHGSGDFPGPGIPGFSPDISIHDMKKARLTTSCNSFVNRENRVPHYQTLFQEGGKKHIRQWQQVRVPKIPERTTNPQPNRMKGLSHGKEYRLTRHADS
jgi:hypothetical protein